MGARSSPSASRSRFFTACWISSTSSPPSESVLNFLSCSVELSIDDNDTWGLEIILLRAGATFAWVDWRAMVVELSGVTIPWLGTERLQYIFFWEDPGVPRGARRLEEAEPPGLGAVREWSSMWKPFLISWPFGDFVVCEGDAVGGLTGGVRTGGVAFVNSTSGAQCDEVVTAEGGWTRGARTGGVARVWLDDVIVVSSRSSSGSLCKNLREQRRQIQALNAVLGGLTSEVQRRWRWHWRNPISCMFSVHCIRIQRRRLLVRNRLSNRSSMNGSTQPIRWPSTYCKFITQMSQNVQTIKPKMQFRYQCESVLEFTINPENNFPINQKYSKVWSRH